LPLYGVTIYVPNADPGPFMEGAQCGRCDQQIPGEPITSAKSDEAGRFTMSDVPAGRDIPLIVTVGKWRKRVAIPMVNECQDNPLPPELTSLPTSRQEGDIPKMAIATGSCDALECLVRKLGIADTEFTPEGGNGRVHLYASNGATKFQNGTTFTPATSLWGDLNKLKQYDIALFSCECSQNATTKPLAAMQAIKDYADFGGRVFLSHYHNIWVDGDSADPAHAPPVWKDIATCDADGYDTGNDVIDQVKNPKGPAFAQWMQNVMGTSTPGVIPIEGGRQTCTAIDESKAERWVYYQDGTAQYPQNFQFSTPNEVPEEQRCGKVVFSDMHVASGSSSSSSEAFPNGCSASPMTPQEKALSFMFFDISTCLGPIGKY
ncbi:MAG TPA: hypothetical protein VMZ53_26730, partial [Kofleriaceae bacterium]|nr:hypothetical protein [Kofleriaceae bacterium]